MGVAANRMLRIVVPLLMSALVGNPIWAETGDPQISIAGDGTLSVAGTAEFPPYGHDGRWTEGTRRSSAQYVIRHFLFMGSGGPPALELYIARNLQDDPPDGAFEIGLVGGFLRGFADQAGFAYARPVWSDTAIGGIPAKRCQVPLKKNDRTIWLYAYILPRRPSLTVLTVRPHPDEAAAIESYLGQVRFY